MIGDNAIDIQAGIAAGVGLNILFAEKQNSELSGLHYHVISTLREALPFMNSRKERWLIHACLCHMNIKLF